MAQPRTVLENIQSIIALEEEQERGRSFSDRIADAIATFAGTVIFVLVHLAWFGLWTSINLGLIDPVPAFDRYPFPLLCMLVSLEGVLLSTFVLIKQNRMSLRADERSHLDLQINLLSEKELTKILQLQKLICSKLGIKEAELDFEVKELSNVTAVDNIAHELSRRLPRNL